jgi:hypothetical protein
MNEYVHDKKIVNNLLKKKNKKKKTNLSTGLEENIENSSNNDN